MKRSFDIEVHCQEGVWDYKNVKVLSMISEDRNSHPYDIFISYRRKTGADDARLLQQALKARGFNVFFDYDSLRDGQFDKRIYAAIEEAPFFILMLSEGALDNCVNEDDWVRLEIEHALKHRRKIIPVAVNPSAWTFPECLPAKIMEGIKNESISELNKASLFDASIDEIISQRIKSNRSFSNGAIGTHCICDGIMCEEIADNKSMLNRKSFAFKTHALGCSVEMMVLASIMVCTCAIIITYYGDQNRRRFAEMSSTVTGASQYNGGCKEDQSSLLEVIDKWVDLAEKSFRRQDYYDMIRCYYEAVNRGYELSEQNICNVKRAYEHEMKLLNSQKTYLKITENNRSENLDERIKNLNYWYRAVINNKPVLFIK